ncbi:MAG: hotdog fold thioesterase [Bacteroidia bacterium]|nr:hotdog fold thioesterase [Bacteroidia bacterium]
MQPKDIVNAMMQGDAFSQWLGIQILEVRDGYCKLMMRVRKEMLNGFSIAHGGITYSLADSALAFASNSLGQKAVSIETSVHHLEKISEGDELIAETFLEHDSKKFGHYSVRIYKSENQTLKEAAYFKGIVYKTGQVWEK